ncbi:sensor histidine kinase [Acidovorax sp. 1608163]|uniref:sensor histidine kinase n=1 Tax=Acidovorax sp. 1608163 TaxID=2478662 RepID=UPI000EF712E6|nr:ATP-binding protein [Acidovorax sp. 1608163]AYM96156.1 sensor histidine kinase [Acidovorax sp. 1608163]
MLEKSPPAVQPLPSPPVAAALNPLHAKDLQAKVIGFVALALVVTAALVALALYTKWQDAIDAQERQNANLARVLQEQTLRVLAPIDQATLRMRDAVAKGSFQPSDYTRLANETGLVPDILTQLSVVGADGRFVASNLDPDGQKTGPLDLSEREHIQVHLEPTRHLDARTQITRNGLFVGKPVLGKVSGQWTLQLSRPIVSPSGYLHGVVVASVDPDYFETVYGDVELGAGGAVSLLGDDNTLRARVAGGKATGMGKSVTLPNGHPLADLNKPEGVYVRVSEVDKTERITAFRRVPGYPLNVVVSNTTEAALEEWRDMRNVTLTVALVLGAAIVASGVGFLRGVRRLEESHAALAISEAQAQSASQAKSEFLAAVSHELRTPLTSIRGFAELMELRLQQPSFREAATLIRQAADHLNTLLTEILDLAKVEAGAMPIVLAPHPVRELVQNTADFFAISAAQKGLTLQVSVSPDTPQLLVCDGLRLKQILNNLLSNALKFTAQGGVRLEVETGAEGTRLQFHVVDSGPGIPQHLHDLIFEKFRQGSAQVSSEHGGTGLGLALSRALAELMHGELTVTSTPGEGARFTLSLPCTEPTAG